MYYILKPLHLCVLGEELDPGSSWWRPDELHRSDRRRAVCVDCVRGSAAVWMAWPHRPAQSHCEFTHSHNSLQPFTSAALPSGHLNMKEKYGGIIRANHLRTRDSGVCAHIYHMQQVVIYRTGFFYGIWEGVTAVVFEREQKILPKNSIVPLSQVLSCFVLFCCNNTSIAKFNLILNLH